jgi:phosphohistidine phosphatase
VRRLHLLRHAKSSHEDPGLTDHDRPLAPRGRTAAALIATHLREQNIEPDLVLCSTAARTRQTLALIELALGEGVSVRYEGALYDATAEGLLEHVTALPDAAESVLLVGHNPAVQELTLALAGTDGGDHAERAKEKFPTAALATLELPGAWRELRPGLADLVAFVRPRELS